MRYLERYGAPGLGASTPGRWQPVTAVAGVDLGQVPTNRAARRRQEARERGAAPSPRLVAAKPVDPTEEGAPEALRTAGEPGERRTVGEVVFEWRPW